MKITICMGSPYVWGQYVWGQALNREFTDLQYVWGQALNREFTDL